MLDINEIYNSQNDRIWAVNRLAADTKGGIQQKSKFPKKIMVWLRVCSKGVLSLVILGDETVDHERYIKEVLQIALKFGNNMLRAEWIFQHDGTKSHIRAKTQE